MSRNVAIVLFDEVEVLDFAGPFEVFGVTRIGEDKPFNVYTVAKEARPVIARNGLSINPHYTFENCPAPDILVVPGGYGSRAAMKDEHMLAFVKQHDAHTELTTSVCTGALILGRAGLLDGLRATTHHGAYDLLRENAPHTDVIEGVRYIDNGRIITSAGIQAGMDMSLHVVARLLGEDTARQTARYMEYQWSVEGTPS